MAQRTIVSLIDDLDGREATQTVKFGLDGVEYAIDLSDKNAEKLRKALAPFAGKARKLRRSSRSSRGVQGGASPREVRAWAKANGYKVPDRGRVPGEVRDAFDKAHAA
jgi:hypothetical protein